MLGSLPPYSNRQIIDLLYKEVDNQSSLINKQEKKINRLFNVVSSQKKIIRSLKQHE